MRKSACCWRDWPRRRQRRPLWPGGEPSKVRRRQPGPGRTCGGRRPPRPAEARDKAAQKQRSASRQRGANGDGAHTAGRCGRRRGHRGRWLQHTLQSCGASRQQYIMSTHCAASTSALDTCATTQTIRCCPLMRNGAISGVGTRGRRHKIRLFEALVTFRLVFADATKALCQTKHVKRHSVVYTGEPLMSYESGTTTKM